MVKFNFEDLLINEEATIKTSMKKLNDVSSKILFVVGENECFVGSLTDGDIRRFFLSNGILDSKVIDACNKNCFKISRPFDKSAVYKKMQELDIIYAPIIDDSGKIVDVLSLPYLKKSEVKHRHGKIDVPVVIMAGGKGTRMAPFTNVLPKPLIPIGDKTILEIIIDEFREYGIDLFFFTINFRGEMIKAYFDCIDRDYNVEYLNELDFYGTAGSLKLLPQDFPKTFIVSNCDIIVNADYSEVLEFHRNSGALLTILSSVQHHNIPYGVINFEQGGIVTSIEEKPEFSFCINTGVYILESECLEYIPEGELFHMTHLIEAIMKDGKKVATYPVNENDYTDIGQWEEYHKSIRNMIQ